MPEPQVVAHLVVAQLRIKTLGGRSPEACHVRPGSGPRVGGFHGRRIETAHVEPVWIADFVLPLPEQASELGAENGCSRALSGVGGASKQGLREPGLFKGLHESHAHQETVLEVCSVQRLGPRPVDRLSQMLPGILIRESWVQLHVLTGGIRPFGPRVHEVHVHTADGALSKAELQGIQPDPTDC